MRRILYFLLLTVTTISMILASGCQTFEAGVIETPRPNLALTRTVQALQTENAQLSYLIANPPENLEQTPQPGSAPSPTPTPTPTSSTSTSLFTSLRFSANPDSPVSQRFYVEGVLGVYAIWDYANMREGMIVRRVWTRNGQPWIEREESWDIDKYGTNGTVRDVAVFVENIGLEQGEYSLTLYVDGVRQAGGDFGANEDSSTFWVFAGDVWEPVDSPDRTKVAYLRNGGKLFVETPDGRVREMAEAQEISEITWFQDNRHLIYTERDRSMQVNAEQDWGINHKLWILDTETGERLLTSTTGENFHHPQISPNGRYLAVLAGNSFSDGCFASPSLVIIALDEEYRRSAVFTLNDFSGLPYQTEVRGGIFPVEKRHAGIWESNTSLTIDLWWLCLEASDIPDGTYRLDMITRTAEFLGGL